MMGSEFDTDFMDWLAWNGQCWKTQVSGLWATYYEKKPKLGVHIDPTVSTELLQAWREL